MSIKNLISQERNMIFIWNKVLDCASKATFSKVTVFSNVPFKYNLRKYIPAVIAVITGRTHCFHDYIYMLCSSCFCWIRAHNVIVDHLWPQIYILHIYYRGACLTENTLYYARVSCDDETYKAKFYKRICGTTF